MYVEKSFDWGKTWKIQRYFAVDCDKDFPGIHKGKYLSGVHPLSAHMKETQELKNNTIITQVVFTFFM
jgi:hypothetical protein